jgi:nucleotide-binding universal stress UspA family protein
MDFRKILIAVNNSSCSIKAAQVGFRLADSVNGEVALLYVIDRNKETVNIEAGPTRQESELLLLKEATTTIDQMISMFQVKRPVYRFTPEGFPKEEIQNTAKEWNADVIVMGTHARTGLSHLLNESLSDYMVRHACVPVLIVPPDMK